MTRREQAIDELMAAAVILQILMSQSECHPTGLVLIRRETVLGALGRVVRALELLEART